MSTSKADIQKTALEAIEKELLAVNALRSIDGSFPESCRNSIRFQRPSDRYRYWEKCPYWSKNCGHVQFNGTWPFLCMLPTQFTETRVLYNPETRLCVFQKRRYCRDQSFGAADPQNGKPSDRHEGWQPESYPGRSADYVLVARLHMKLAPTTWPPRPVLRCRWFWEMPWPYACCS